MKKVSISHYQPKTLYTTRDRIPTPEFCNSSPRQQKTPTSKAKSKNSLSQSHSITVNLKHGLRGSGSHSSGYFKNLLRGETFTKPSGRNVSQVQFRYETLSKESYRASPQIPGLENLSSRRGTAPSAYHHVSKSMQIQTNRPLKPVSKDYGKKFNGKNIMSNMSNISGFAVKKRELTPIKAEPEVELEAELISKENVRRTPPLECKNIKILSPTSTLSPMSPRFEIVDEVTPKNGDFDKNLRIDKFTFQGTMTNRSSAYGYDVEGNCTSRFPGLFENTDDIGSFCEVNLMVAQEKPGIMIKTSQKKNLMSHLRNF